MFEGHGHRPCCLLGKPGATGHVLHPVPSIGLGMLTHHPSCVPRHWGASPEPTPHAQCAQGAAAVSVSLGKSFWGLTFRLDSGVPTWQSQPLPRLVTNNPRQHKLCHVLPLPCPLLLLLCPWQCRSCQMESHSLLTCTSWLGDVTGYYLILHLVLLHRYAFLKVECWKQSTSVPWEAVATPLGIPQGQ